ARIYTAALAFGIAVAAGCAWVGRGITAHEDTERENSNLRVTSYGLRITYHVSRFQAWSLALLALAALGTLGIYVAYNLQFVQPQGRYLFPALPAISLAVAVGWWTVARWPAAARWAGIALLAAAGAAVLWGVTQEGINRWSMLIFGGGAAALWLCSLVSPRLRDATRGQVCVALYVLPFAAMAALSALALWAFVLPQLT
ncbi:MAG TPA: hypothetical protein VL334_05900, partial [Anaerolineae bacterium]|nr:hypothetical protein [Anaerolineae bacterium]